MNFEQLTLKNVDPYFGSQRLSFVKEKQHDVTGIHDINEAEKLIVCRAIYWCFYGNSNVRELISEEAVRVVNVSEHVNMCVELSFKQGDERYMVKRSRRCTKWIDGSIVSNYSDEFTLVRIHGEGRTESVKNPIKTINDFLLADRFISEIIHPSRSSLKR